MDTGYLPTVVTHQQAQELLSFLQHYKTLFGVDSVSPGLQQLSVALALDLNAATALPVAGSSQAALQVPEVEDGAAAQVSSIDVV